MYYTYFFKHYYQKSTQKYTIYTSSNITTKKVHKKLLYGLLCSFIEAKIYYIYFFRVTINTKTTKTTKPSKKLVIIHRFGIYVIYLPNLILLFVHYTTYLPKLVLYFNSFLKISILVFGIIRFYQTFPSWHVLIGRKIQTFLHNF